MEIAGGSHLKLNLLMVVYGSSDGLKLDKSFSIVFFS